MADALRSLSYGVYVLSTRLEDKQNACIINTFTQVSSDPVKIAAALSKQNYTCELLLKSGVFCGAVLSELAQIKNFGPFGFRSGRDYDKFSGVSYRQAANGVYFPTDNVTAVFSCEVVDKIDVGSHIIFIGKLTDSEVLSDEPVMTYEYYHRVKKGKTAKNSPTFSNQL